MKLTSLRVIGLFFLLGTVVGLAVAALFASIQETLGVLSDSIGIGTFFFVVGIAYLAYRRHALGEETVKVFVETKTHPDGTGIEHPVVTRIRFPWQKKNIRFCRRELTPLFLIGFLREAFFSLSGTDLSFIIQENLDAFKTISAAGTELHLQCSDHKVFAKVFSAFQADIPEVADKIAFALKKGGAEIVVAGENTSLCYTEKLSNFGKDD